ncbi:MAG: AsmA-like C-terminal region-containing protein [bacterium]
MWKLLKFLSLIIKTVFWIFLLLILAAGVCLYVFEQGVPDAFVQRIAEKLSTDELVCRIERVNFSLRSGLTLKNIKLFRKRTTAETLFSIEKVNAEFAIFTCAPVSERLKRLTVTSFDFPVLPKRKPKQPGEQPAPFPDITLPSVSPFELVLENPNILGIRAEKVTALITAKQPTLSVSDIKAIWPDKPNILTVIGGASINVEEKRLVGNITGQAYPGHITPLLSQLRGARNAVTQIDCFQNIARPMNATYTVDLNLDTLDYAMSVDVDGGKCTYRGVPVQFVKTMIWITDSNNLVKVDIDIKDGATHTGTLKGRLIYNDRTDALLIDGSATVAKDELLSILHVLYRGELNSITCDSGLRVAAKGVVTVNSDNPLTTNDLHVGISFDKGSILRIPVAKTSTDLHFYDYSALCNTIQTTLANGGTATGTFHAFFPGYSASNTTFVTKLSADKADFANILCIADPTNTYTGRLTGAIQLSGALTGDILSSLKGDGRMEITDGVFARIPLFSGLTAWLANNIPGIGTVVNQSSGNLSFVITNGVVTTHDLVVEGSIFSIAGNGTLTLPTNALNMSMKVNIFKERSFAGQISRVVAFPFTRMLLDFHLGGTTKQPIWAYVTILEKITDSLTPGTTSTQ